MGIPTNWRYAFAYVGHYYGTSPKEVDNMKIEDLFWWYSAILTVEKANG